MRKREDVLGNKYGRWTVIDDNFKTTKNHRKVLCRCNCGTERKIDLNRLKSSKSKSCGCLRKELLIKRQTKHNYCSHKLHKTWTDIKQRCYNKNNKSYKYYGKRGIKICKEWKNNPKLFIEWCLSNGWNENLQIDRRDNDGNYDPSNCRFVTNQENCLNRRLLNSKNTSKYCGVSYVKKNKNYRVQIKYNNKIIYAKYCFKTAKEAAIARDKYIIENDLPHKLNFTKLKK